MNTESKLRILAVVGSTHPNSAIRMVVVRVAEDLRVAGCEVDVLDFSKEALPLFNPESAHRQPGFAVLKGRV